MVVCLSFSEHGEHHLLPLSLLHSLPSSLPLVTFSLSSWLAHFPSLCLSHSVFCRFSKAKPEGTVCCVTSNKMSLYRLCVWVCVSGGVKYNSAPACSYSYDTIGTRWKTSDSALDGVMARQCWWDLLDSLLFRFDSPASRDTPNTFTGSHYNEPLFSAAAPFSDLTGGAEGCRNRGGRESGSYNQGVMMGWEKERVAKEEEIGRWWDGWVGVRSRMKWGLALCHCNLHLPQRPCQCDAMPEWLMGHTHTPSLSPSPLHWLNTCCLCRTCSVPTHTPHCVSVHYKHLYLERTKMFIVMSDCRCTHVSFTFTAVHWLIWSQTASDHLNPPIQVIVTCVLSANIVMTSSYRDVEKH